MGICFSNQEMVRLEDVQRDGKWEKEDEKSVFQVKVRLTAKELRELVAQAESGDAVGSLLLSRCLVRGNFEVEWPQLDDDGRSCKKKTKRLETINEEGS